jgi:hypothetical protein
VRYDDPYGYRARRRRRCVGWVLFWAGPLLALLGVGQDVVAVLYFSPAWFIAAILTMAVAVAVMLAGDRWL